MDQVVSLHDCGVRLFFCRLCNHDYLWFSSYEISKISTAMPVLHNYAVTYSLSDFSYGISWNTAPHYAEDLVRMSLYTTPAVAQYWSRTRITYNAVNSRSLRTDDAPRGVNSPDLGWRNYLDPVCPLSDRDMQQVGFACYVFTFNGQQPKGVTRLGKKGAAIRIHREEIDKPLAVFRDETVRPTHPLNPLDISGQVNLYEPISIPPHLLLRTAEVQNDWFVFSGPHRVHVPKRILERCQV
ncbi:MAG: type I-D CRISPR-associated protein Cas5/Csc1 [Candidatus Methanosuratus sp.]|nr:type I-D CRISPR-associated protein Cas5/Csc1 [Candidatus Methanosuratincola sp.]